MGINNKISPAFEPFMMEKGANDVREAIVVYKAPALEKIRVRGRIRALKKRLDDIKKRAQPTQERLFKGYQKAGQKCLSKKTTLNTSSIGGSQLPVASIEVTAKTINVLAEQPDVLAVLPNQRISLIKPMEVEYPDLIKQEVKDGLTWGLKSLGIEELWKSTKGKDINVAVLDTGVYSAHPALQNRVKDFIVVDPLGRWVKASPAFDADGHGTHVCGTIAGGITPDGVSIGVAPEANLHVAAVLAGTSTIKTLLESIDWAINKGADIINMSLGFTYYEPRFEDILQQLVELYDILPVVAIGNENHGNTSSPGNIPNAFSVGALEKEPKNRYKVAPFSSGASLVFPGTNNDFVTKPDVVAPGVQVYSCIPPKQSNNGIIEYDYMHGTSMAAPHVAGVAALLMAAKPDARVNDIVNALKKSAEHPDGVDKRPDNRWGHGMIRPNDALKLL